MVQIICVSL